jgi:hypothetical protein
MRIIVALLALVVTSGCAGSPGTEGTGPTKESGPTPRVEPLVATWERVTRCEELVSALKQAGLEDWVLESVAGNGFIPGYPDPAHPCEGAVPRVHSHFFTRDGEFGSLDWKGEQVDDGTYKIVDGDTFVVSKEFPDVTFNYTIQGDTIMFDPVITDCSPGCFEAAWSVTVAYPGETWDRVS